MMKRFIVAAAALSLALQPIQVAGQGFAPTPSAQEYLDFVGGSGVGGSGGIPYQVGPYRGSFGSSPGTTFALYCVDYLHSAKDVTVNATSLAPGTSLGNTRLGDFDRYRKTAYLASLFDSWATYETDLETLTGESFDKSMVWSGLHAAIWNFGTGPTDLGSGAVGDAREYFRGLADLNAGAFSTEGWYVLTDARVPSVAGTSADRHTGQEFLVRTREPVPVPEPAAALLMASGLLLLAGAGRRRSKVVVRRV